MTNSFNQVTGFFFPHELTIICRGRNPHIVQTLLENSLQKWSLNTGFMFFGSSPVVIIFSEGRHYTNIHLCRKGQGLKEISTIKLLGLTFDSRITWKPHMKKLISQCYQRLNILQTTAANNWGATMNTLLLR